MTQRNSMNDVAMLKVLQQAFHRLATCDARCWTPHFFQTHKGANGAISFDARQIAISPPEEWKRYLDSLEKDYVSGKKAFLKGGFSFREYDGSAPEEGTALHAECTDGVSGQIVCDFTKALVNADVERGGKDLKENGFTICGKSEEGLRTIFVSAHTPLAQLKNRFWLLHDATEYTPVDRPLLVLPKRIDALIVGDDAWFLTLQGTQLFAPDSICRKIAQEKISTMNGIKWIEGFDTFAKAAVTGYNPRRFLAFNAEKVTELADALKRKRIAKKFNISLKPSGKIDLSDPASANNFIKVVCDKAMVDPFNDGPMEVSGAKKWNVR